MSQTIELWPYPSGTHVVITNGTKASVTYRADCGERGEILFTLIPGGSFTIVVGTVPPQLYMEDGAPPGIRGL